MNLVAKTRLGLQSFASALLISWLCGCSAPIGPIGWTYINKLLLNHCHSFSNGTCEENDPTVIPPHSNFHPLPTRPVFSPPAAIPGVYNPWPEQNAVPTRDVFSPPDAAEVSSPTKQPSDLQPQVSRAA